MSPSGPLAARQGDNPAADPAALALALETARRGQRLSPQEALTLWQGADLLTLGHLAQRARLRHNPDPVVTYVVDRNINTTNACLSGCRFCAFFRPPGHPEARDLGLDELFAKIEEALALGGTQVLIQGGLHPAIGIRATCATYRAIKQKFPSLHIHGLSPPEVVHMAALDGLGLEQALDELMASGLDSIPGGGAEILVDRVRRLIAPGKCGAEQWLEVMALAHARGLMTTATMMFGSLETPAERIEHFERLRRLQDDSLRKGRGRFTAFIPWSFQPANTALAHLTTATGVEYLRVLALARLYLDNFPHLQASWVTQGAKIAQLALSFGADDLGSTMIEENVVAAAGVSFRLPRAELVRLAQAMGYEARQRDMFYHLL